MVFVDTGPFLARYLSRDSHHHLAVALWTRMAGEPIFTSNQVSFTDCLSFALMKREGIRTAFAFGRRFLSAGFNVIGLDSNA